MKSVKRRSGEDVTSTTFLTGPQSIMWFQDVITKKNHTFAPVAPASWKLWPISCQVLLSSCFACCPPFQAGELEFGQGTPCCVQLILPRRRRAEWVSVETADGYFRPPTFI